MTSKEMALFAANALNEKKAMDISVIDISEKSGFADYFVISSAANLRQLGALCDELDNKLAKEGAIVKHIEGKGDSGWILMDFGDVIINLFTAEQRGRFNIDKVWSDCVALDIEFKTESEN